MNTTDFQQAYECIFMIFGINVAFIIFVSILEVIKYRPLKK